MGLWQAALVRMGVAQPGPKITAQDRAILDLKLQRDKLRQYQRRLQSVLDREHEIARDALAKGDRRRAHLALRQRKYQSATLQRTDAQLATLQDLVASIEFTQIQAAVMHGLEAGSAALRALQAEVSLERVERIVDESREGVAYQREIEEVLATRMSPGEEDEVVAELEAMVREMQPDATDATKVPVLPDAPTKDPVLPDAQSKDPVALPDAPTAEPEPERENKPERVMLAA
ncbi:hypothetical protein CspeluHIS016_0210490 [Cutaneotrichosporon spelunceum]|uniref:Snf7-domain-containing protein n=1 Tax=Cutaneotrichosporon spelunceum TaxID=1672016 RepID=A0AAD3TS83_9TREE|nr:hypothetical protein CspeluHIS016_0210490 [Cutaneotrichosporon spelunceum]